MAQTARAQAMMCGLVTGQCAVQPTALHTWHWRSMRCSLRSTRSIRGSASSLRHWLKIQVDERLQGMACVRLRALNQPSGAGNGGGITGTRACSSVSTNTQRPKLPTPCRCQRKLCL
ncbi:hypothetical protein HYPSUDRAFT_969902 [Hypholoma sublateritium FD-334 SS-4]|uniref:Uncharacterized protein n=1 Tax=Hypholoma sublateritium (strain FD-334 SS-4) TaxID=945553 RepID=A0A0D2PCM6_HYPSF|nr:hypothetical protein HYPSUDRAFT_969902 [Hypholoma sublateritium FD-334 SS-4]